MAVQTPNMFLYLPTLGVDSGITWETDVNANSDIIDGHNHSVGSGVQINPDGININTDLPFNDNNAITLRSARFFIQPAPISLPADLGCIYVSGVDLYYNDVNLNQIQITKGGTVNATSSGISDGTATASFVGNTLVVDAASNTPANIQGASLLLGNTGISGSFYLTLSPPSALASNYSLTLPPLPPQTNVMTLTPSGTMGSITYDQVGENMTVVGADAIAASIDSTGANNIISEVTVVPTTVADTIAEAMDATGVDFIANTRTRTISNPAPLGGVAIAASCGLVTVSTTSPVLVTNQSIQITSGGRPIFIGIWSDGISSGSYWENIPTSGTGQTAFLSVIRNGSSGIATYNFTSPAGNTSIFYTFPPAMLALDVVSASTYTYTLELSVTNTGGATVFAHYRMFAYEL